LGRGRRVIRGGDASSRAFLCSRVRMFGDMADQERIEDKGESREHREPLRSLPEGIGFVGFPPGVVEVDGEIVAETPASPDFRIVRLSRRSD